MYPDVYLVLFPSVCQVGPKFVDFLFLQHIVGISIFTEPLNWKGL